MSVRTWADRHWWQQHDQQWAVRFNRGITRRPLLVTCRIASRLGDGIAWYALILLLPWCADTAGSHCAMHMAVTGAAGLLIYLVLKRWLARPRPCTVCADIQLAERALDQFSFPSGHSLHAVNFTLILAFHFPLLGLALLPLTALIALSRVVLGLHYPSDVIGGVVIGLLVAGTSLWWWHQLA